MTLTVRLDSALESALARYCEDHGVTKSLVVQESLAVYLLNDKAQAAQRAAVPPAAPPIRVSQNYKAFADAGFIGAGELGGGSADKAKVRATAMQRIRRSGR